MLYFIMKKFYKFIVKKLMWSILNLIS